MAGSSAPAAAAQRKLTERRTRGTRVFERNLHVDLKTRKRLFNLCDPAEPLDPDDPRNVDIDALEGLDVPARGRSWVDTLARPIELAGRPTCTLFTGLRGSGVTTELLRLSARLRDKKGANLLPVLINAGEVLDLFSEIDVPDVLLAVLERTGNAVAIAEGKPMPDRVLPRFQKWLSDLSVDSSGPGDRPQASAILRTNPSARAAFRARVGISLSHFVAEVRDELTLLDGRARRAGNNGIAVVFDSINHLRGTSMSWKAVLDSAERLFAIHASYLELPVHVVYTVPAPLVFRLNAPIHFLPQIEIFDRTGRRSSGGFEAARRLIRQRVPDTILQEMLGSEAGDWVDRLIGWSGGKVQDLVRLLQSVIAEPSFERQRLEQLFSLTGETYRHAVPESAHAWLARVHVEKTLSIRDQHRDETADLMLLNGVVLRYQDDDAWFDIHPAVQSIPGIAQAINQLQREP